MGRGNSEKRNESGPKVTGNAGIIIQFACRNRKRSGAKGVERRKRTGGLV